MEQTFLKLALDEARKGQGFCAPNPAVGAVLVREGQVIAKGYHCGPGQPHAEVEALRSVSDEDCRRSTLYVTLEPCCHFGRTPPCTDLILSRGIPNVVFAYLDPNPLVAGQGMRALQQAGVRCTHVECPGVSEFYAAYSFWWKNKRPRFTAKIAMSLDGKIAAAGGRPLPITGEQARQFTHTHRLHADAILTTAQTILADDPSLNARLESGDVAKSVYVLDRLGRLPWTAKVIRTAKKLTVFHGIEADEVRLETLKSSGVELVRAPTTSNGLDLAFVAEYLGKVGLHDVWLEAGGKSFLGLYRAGLMDRAFLLLGNRWLGGEALPAFDGLPEDFFSSMHQSAWSALGSDGLLEARWNKCLPA